VVPLLSMTLFTERPIVLSLFILTPTGFSFSFRIVRVRPLFPPTNPRRQPFLRQSNRHERGYDHYQPWRHRAHMMLMTVLAILAVDFPIFSRSFAKCETYGVSLVCLPFLSHSAVNFTLRLIVRRWTWGLVLLFSRKASSLQYL